MRASALQRDNSLKRGMSSLTQFMLDTCQFALTKLQSTVYVHSLRVQGVDVVLIRI